MVQVNPWRVAFKCVCYADFSAKPFDLIQLFVASKKELEAQLPKQIGLLKRNGLFWVTYPKGNSRVEADVNRDIIREYAESNGFKAVALISIDDTWSALRLKVV